MALLDRVLVRGPQAGPETDGIEASRMSLLEHLEALRRAIVISIMAWFACGLVSFFFWGRVLDFLIWRGGVHEVSFTAPQGAFLLALKIAIYMGFAIASPIIIQQAWWFVSPGLHRHERRLVLPLILATFFFFAFGIAFAMFTLPLFIKILVGFAPGGLHFFPLVDEYLSFVLVLVIGFGVVFELPVVLYGLGLMRVISSGWLYRHRFYWVIGLGILSAMATPGADPITPILMFVPLYLFWEGTALLLKLTGR
jgi:sec-independent protein translocase protein TatC